MTQIVTTHKERTPNANYHHMQINKNTPYEKYLLTPLVITRRII